MKTYLSVLMCLCLGLFSCKKETVVKSKNGNDIVVQGYLYPDKPATILLSNLDHFDNDQSNISNIENIPVSISQGDHNYNLVYQGNGQYVADTSLKIKVGISYSLNIITGSQPISSITSVPRNSNKL